MLVHRGRRVISLDAPLHHGVEQAEAGAIRRAIVGGVEQTHMIVDVRANCYFFNHDYDAFRRRPGRLQLVDKRANPVTEQSNVGGGERRRFVRVETSQGRKKSLVGREILMN
jgi:hypothetical protein